MKNKEFPAELTPSERGEMIRLRAENDIAVFSSIAKCWSGYLGTHVAMTGSIGFSYLIGRSIASHTIAGIRAGIAAN